MEITYRLLIIDGHGMYTRGDTAQTPALAKMAPGSLLRSTIQSGNKPRTLGVERTEWTRDRDGNPKAALSVLVEAEEWPGQWTIGVPGSEKYSPGIKRPTE